MADHFASDLALVIIAQIAQTIGYSSTLSAPLELLQDIMHKFTQEFSRDLHGHMEHANRTQPNLKDARLSIKNLNINIQELLDYIGNVEPVGFARDVAQFPIKKAVNMNFLKPGSAETLTRPVYIFEYLPPMQDPEPLEIQTDTQKEFTQKREFVSKPDVDATSCGGKLPSNHVDSISSIALVSFPSNSPDLDIGRSVREMSSVVMTTGGFISPAIEGKLPEAFIPDIIEKYRGLNAPPPSSIVVMPLENSKKFEANEKKTEIISRKIIPKPPQFLEANKFNQNVGLLSNDNANDKNPTTTISKKIKKHKEDVLREPGQKGKFNNIAKSHEKSQRRALKMYHKLARNQNDLLSSEMLQLKKSKKRVNRVYSSSEANKIHSEKMLKKQVKYKQKSLQLELVDKNYSSHQSTIGFNFEENINTEDLNPADIHTEAPLVIREIESNSQSSIFPVQTMDQSQVPLPERSKLDIFKKISKPRSHRQDDGLISVPPGIDVRVFGSNTTPLISLPSGTTITPAPSLGLNVENKSISNMKMNLFGTLDYNQLSPEVGVKKQIIDSVKPKKRGRKPGGKNLVKNVNCTSHSSIESSKNEKSTNVIPLPLASSSLQKSQHFLAAPIPTEPLNLCNTELASNESFPSSDAKYKRERKKCKSKYDTILTENINICSTKVNSPERTSSTLTTLNAPKQKKDLPDSFMAISSAIPNTALYPGNQTGMVPLLPLLHFPPRPGLIPSGPGLFPPVSGLVGFGNNNNRVGIPPFIAFSGSDGSVTDIVRCQQIANSTDIATDQMQRGPSTDRNYCNVAPLVPDSMKLDDCKPQTSGNTELGNAFAKASPKFKAKRALAQASGNFGDPIEVSDDSDESIQNKKSVKKKSPFPSPNRIASKSIHSHSSSFGHSISKCEDKTVVDLRNILTVTSNESNEKFKKSVKLSIPDVKTIINTASTPSTFPQFNLPNFTGGDKFSLAGGADLIPLSRIDCGSAYSSHKVPSSSLAGGATSGLNSILPNHITISEEQQFLPPYSNYEDITITPTDTLSLDLKARKHHKKLKKLKEGKVKKKKNKKDKSKRKDRMGVTSCTTDKKIRGLDKRQKKERKKDKDKQILIHVPDESDEFSVEPLIDSLEVDSTQNEFVGTTVQHSPSQIPKITLKLSGKSTYPTSEDEKEAPDAGKANQQNILPAEIKDRQRNNSPELARFSPLVTGPPKTKQSETHLLGIPSTGSILLNNYDNSAPFIPVTSQISARTMQIPISQSSLNSVGWQHSTNNSTAASSTLSASSVLLPQQLRLIPNTVMASFPSVIAESAGTATISDSLNSPICISAENSYVAEKSRPSSYVDADGNRIWICPACGKVDDGSAMIGCDGCDAWYHWICVGITFAPKDNDDWFCRVCVTKKGVHEPEKKKRRNKKK
ncbi:uncharacterized protein LOC108102367 isoform X2 [Drosophila eugracilis]|uniref:uncharacterized protein LOC108102367 isoform X2 n=1 Tax=Drosophila eugracilis TaxID=29029 RepID=UPI001BDAE739|nr:uncharacterized protein LOC108102367 isoform X2 [Drosophila eugracilis]